MDTSDQRRIANNMELDQTSSNQPLQNAKWEIFAQNIANGLTLYEASKAIYKAKTKHSHEIYAQRLLKKSLVRDRVDFLKRENARMNGLSRAEKRELLAKIARGDIEITTIVKGKEIIVPPSFKDRISAIMEDNRMTGDSDEKKEIPNFTINLVK